MTQQFLRELKHKKMDEIQASLILKPTPELTAYNNVALSPVGLLDVPYPATSGKWIADDNDRCAELIFNPQQNWPLIKGKTVYGGWLRKCWGHFIMGGLARLWPFAIQKPITDVDTIIFFSEEFDSNLYGNYLELMQLLGIADKVRIVNSTLRFENLIIPDISFEHDRFFTKEIRSTFNLVIHNALNNVDKSNINKSENLSSSLPKKLFLTRSEFSDVKKNEINIELINRFFSDNGYYIVSPERISLREFIRLLSHADEIASIAGSLAHNFMFVPPEKHTKFTIIERHAFPNVFQLNINNSLSSQPVYVDAFFMPRLSSSSGPVFLYGLTSYFKIFISSNNFNYSALKNLDSMKARMMSLRKFLKRYNRKNGHGENLHPWETDFGNVYAEAITETNNYFAPWLIHKLPILSSDFLSPVAYFRIFKKLLN